jgi:predicted dehydrogenase/nucleoside-diphosphate-sugar epimerase
MTLKAGIVGAGGISRFHLQALKRLPNVTVVGVCDLDEARARKLATEFSVQAFTSLQALREAGAQVIHVLTPPAAHAKVALEALSLGCDVLVEKPLATTAEDCDRIAARARELGRIVCVGHSLLFDPFVSRARALVEQGAIGEVLTFDYFRCQTPPSYPVSGATAEQQAGGFPFRDLGVHALYLAEAFVGPTMSVDAWPMITGRGDCNQLVDEWRVMARCERGTAQFQMSWNVRPQQNYFIVQGTRGTIRCDLFGLSVTMRRQRPMPEHARRVVNAVVEGTGQSMQAVVNLTRFVRGKLRQFHGLQALVEDFYGRLADGRPPAVGPEDARRVVYWTEHVARLGDVQRDDAVREATSNKSQPRVLVTGGTGFIGKRLVGRLLDAGEPVRLLARRIPPAAVRNHPLVEVVLGDLGDPRVVDQAVQGIRTVYHIGAAMTGGVDDHERGTVKGTGNMVDACVRHNVERLVYMSSLSVVDSDVRHVDEQTPLEPRPELRGHYTRVKGEAERIVREAVGQRGLQAVLLRPGGVVGSDKPLLTPAVAQRLGSLLVVIGDGSLDLGLVHVNDVVDAMLTAATARIESGTVIQLVEPSSLTQNEVIAHYRSKGLNARVMHIPVWTMVALAATVEKIFGLMGRGSPIGPRRIRAATTPRTYDCRRAADLLGWKARTGVRAAFGADELRPSEPAPAPAVQEAVGGRAS